MRSQDLALGSRLDSSELTGHNKKMNRGRGPFRDSFENILVAIFLALFVRTYIVTGYKVPTSTMAPTLLPGDFIFAFRPPAGFKIPLTSIKLGAKLPERGDLVVFTFPDQPRTTYVKRVVGLPGDQVQMESGRLILNGEKFTYQKLSSAEILDNPAFDQYEVWHEQSGQEFHRILRKQQSGGQNFGPLTIPPGEIFVLGDHREASDDSRYWGTVPLERIEGRVVFVWLSLDWAKPWGGSRLPSLRSERLFTRVH